MKQHLIGGTAALFVILFGAYSVRAHVHAQPQPQPVVAQSIDGDLDQNNDDGDSAAATDQMAAVADAASPHTVAYKVSSSTPQYVLFSFDGSKSIAMLNETLDFTHTMAAQNKPIKFTYFINAAYFLTNENASLYQGPGEPRGTSAIGFSTTAADIPLRIAAFNRAFAEGDEVGSHSSGHFDGTNWSEAQWQQEFDSFVSLMTNVAANNPTQKIDPPQFLASIKGFRAPNLGFNQHLFDVMAKSGFTYDASGTTKMGLWPTKDARGLWHISLAAMHLGDNPNPIVSMDYNLWMRQSSGKELDVKGTPQWDHDYNDVVAAYTNYFDTSYNGSRAPIVIADHFSKWNDGVYWEAMKTVAENVCGLPNVRCTTFSNLVDYLNTTGVPPIAN